MSHASDAYAHLIVAVDATPPPCRDIELFTTDDLNATDRAVLESICASCSVFDLCRNYADVERPKAGYWAGKTYRNYKPKEKP